MIEVKRDENGKRHIYASTWAYVAFYAIVGGLYGLVLVGLTSLIPGKVVTVMLWTWVAIMVIVFIVRKTRKGDKS